MIEPVVTIKRFTNDNLGAAEEVVSSVFGKETCSILHHALKNPILDELDSPDAGVVLYLDGSPVGFDATIVRKMYFGQQPFFGTVGSTICLKSDERRSLVAIDLMVEAIRQRHGSLLFFGNSANKSGMRLNRAFGMKSSAPESCAHKRIAVIRKIRFLVYLIRTRVFKRIPFPIQRHISDRIISYEKRGKVYRRITELNQAEIDRFWCKYLATNKGLVSSRSYKEIDWLFGPGLRNRSVIIVGGYAGEDLVGYVVLGAGSSSSCWHVLDLIALDNDLEVLRNLLKYGIKVLGVVSNAVHCEVSGFADYVQSIIAESFPIRRALTNNQFAWKFYAEQDAERMEGTMGGRDSWFWGPYDGDRCLV